MIHSMQHLRRYQPFVHMNTPFITQFRHLSSANKPLIEILPKIPPKSDWPILSIFPGIYPKSKLIASTTMDISERKKSDQPDIHGIIKKCFATYTVEKAGRLLAEQYSPDYEPLGFITYCYQIECDVREGIDSSRNKPIQSAPIFLRKYEVIEFARCMRGDEYADQVALEYEKMPDEIPVKSSRKVTILDIHGIIKKCFDDHTVEKAGHLLAERYNPNCSPNEFVNYCKLVEHDVGDVSIGKNDVINFARHVKGDKFSLLVMLEYIYLTDEVATAKFKSDGEDYVDGGK